MARPSQARALSNSCLSRSGGPCFTPCSTSVSGRRKKESTSSPSSSVTSVSHSSSSSASCSSSQARPDYLRVAKGPRASTPCARSPSDLPVPKLKLPSPSIMLMPGPAKKLDRMLGLIRCADAQFFNDPGVSRIEFPIKKSPRVLRQAKIERLRSLVALAHHFDELDIRRAMDSCSDASLKAA